MPKIRTEQVYPWKGKKGIVTGTDIDCYLGGCGRLVEVFFLIAFLSGKMAYKVICSECV